MLKINEITIIDCEVNQLNPTNQDTVSNYKSNFGKNILKIQSIEAIPIPVKDNLIQKSNLIKDVKNNI